jgi:hypothetical protein
MSELLAHVTALRARREVVYVLDLELADRAN